MLSVTNYLPALSAHIEQYIPLQPADKELLASLVKARRILKRQFLLQADSICRHENFVVEGCLRLFYVDEKGAEHTLQFAIENWWIGDLESLLSGAPSDYHIEALEPTIVLQIDVPSLEILYNKIPLFDRYFRILHQHAYIAQSKRILQNISLTGEERYERFMESYPQWHARIPQKHIASYLGITPEFLSQIRKNRSIRK